MFSFGNQLYELVLPKDHFTQPIELISVRPILSIGGTIGVPLIRTGVLFTAPLDRITFITGFAALVSPGDVGVAQGLCIEAIDLGVQTNCLAAAPPAGNNLLSPIPFGWNGEVAIPPGVNVRLACFFSAATVTVAPTLDEISITGWSIPRGSISIR